jgi:hypothetical protein
MMKKILPMIIAFVFLIAANVSADIYWSYNFFSPPEGFSIENGTIINFSAVIEANGSDLINGTICLTWDTSTNAGICGSPVEGVNIAGIDVYFTPYFYNYTTGSFYWRANYTHNDSTVYFSNQRNWNIILTKFVLIPVYPINGENVTGDYTNFMVNYTVDVYFPSEIHSPRYVYFYGYSSYSGTPLSSSERTICVIKLDASSENPLSSGIHRIGCENYMYDSFITNYEELPSYNPKYWKAKMRILEGEVDGANLVADTGYQKYNYFINTQFSHIYPRDEAVYCEYTLFLYNASWVSIQNMCQDKKAYHNQVINFHSYLNNTCGNANLTFRFYNYANTSQKGDCEIGGITNNSFDYWNCGLVINPNSKNTTYYNVFGKPFISIHLVYNWTLSCPNGSSYVTPDYDLWYIIGISPANVTGYPTFPYPINMSYLMPMLSTYWASAFQTSPQGGLMFMAIFFLLAMTVILIINADIIAGIGTFIYGFTVFIRIGYIEPLLIWIMLVLSGMIVVYFVRKFILTRYG